MAEFWTCRRQLGQQLAAPLKGGVEWGKTFGWLLGARRVLERADAVLTCNRTEAMLLKQKYPDKIVMAQPTAWLRGSIKRIIAPPCTEAFPELNGKQVLLVVGRIDPVKNQGWIVSQFPRALERHPRMHLVLAGACTDEAYGKLHQERDPQPGVRTVRDLDRRVAVELAATDRLVPIRRRRCVTLSFRDFRFGHSRGLGGGHARARLADFGALDLIREGENGWLFDSTDPATFHHCLDALLQDPARAQEMAKAGQARVEAEFDCEVLAKRIKHLYEELIDV